MKHPHLPHYIGRVQLVGCLPDCCDVYETNNSAVSSLLDIYDLSARQAKELRLSGDVDLDMNRNGHSGYAHIEECFCLEPWQHQDDATEARWKRENGWNEYYDGRLSWREGSSAYYVTDELSQETRCVGDGVDMFHSEARSEFSNTISSLRTDEMMKIDGGTSGLHIGNVCLEEEGVRALVKALNNWLRLPLNGAIMPGTKEFAKRMNEFVKDSEVFEAYFGDSE